MVCVCCVENNQMVTLCCSTSFLDFYLFKQVCKVSQWLHIIVVILVELLWKEYEWYIRPI